MNERMTKKITRLTIGYFGSRVLGIIALIGSIIGATISGNVGLMFFLGYVFFKSLSWAIENKLEDLSYLLGGNQNE